MSPRLDDLPSAFVDLAQWTHMVLNYPQPWELLIKMYRQKKFAKQNEDLVMGRQLEPDLALTVDAEEIEYRCPDCE